MKILSITLITFLLIGCNADPKGEQVDAQAAKTSSENKAVDSLEVDVATSIIKWEGTKPTGSHVGDLRIKSGHIEMKDGQLAGGIFVLDMTSIEVTDLEGEGKEKLEKHLKMGDFFEVETYPTGQFEIIEVSASSDSTSTHMIGGNLTMLDTTNYIQFPASVMIDENGFSATTPAFTIDRTQWGIVYKSSKLGDMAINDRMGLEITLNAK